MSTATQISTKWPLVSNYHIHVCPFPAMSHFARPLENADMPGSIVLIAKPAVLAKFSTFSFSPGSHKVAHNPARD